MRVQRLSWAGIRIVGRSGSLLIDALGDANSVERFMGAPREPLIPVPPADAALITHLHPDHFDPVALNDVEQLFCPAGADPGRDARSVDVWEEIHVAGFRCTAVPAVDGFGDPQVSWVVDDGAARVIHCGDTLWHGHWWRIASRLGPFAAAFLCINGTVVRFPGLTPSEVEADLTPEQAAAAAAVLGVERAVPIHYGTFDAPPVYEETAEAEQRFLAAAAARGVRTEVMAPGEEIEL